ncbi:MAG: hypothetical protein K0R05_2093, partial [Anaerocolumna sp.]|nr:hypothetical protein [Anaerocolumna sp.]
LPDSRIILLGNKRYPLSIPLFHGIIKHMFACELMLGLYRYGLRNPLPKK